MLDYNKLSEQVEEILLNLNDIEIDSWLKFDQIRIENENFTNGRKVIITIDKVSETKFNNVNCTFRGNDNDNFSLAA